jgi:hypothetical protein
MKNIERHKRYVLKLWDDLLEGLRCAKFVDARLVRNAAGL